MANEFKVKNGVIAPALFNTVNNDLAISASGTGKLKLNGLSWPSADGTANYVLKTDGAGNLSWAAQTGGGGGGSSTVTVDQFTGTGSQTNFTLSVAPTGVNYTFVTIDGVVQRRTYTYSVSGTTLTFTEAPALGAGIEVVTYSVTIAGVASQLSAGRTISLTGDVTYTSGLFDGTTNTTGVATLANTTVTAGSYTNANVTVDSKGRITAASNGTGGTVTSVSGTGTVSGLTLTGTVTGSGSLTLGGTLDLSSPPAIGGTAAAAGTFTTLSASSTVSGTGFSTYLASPPAIGGTTAASGTFTTLVGSSVGATQGTTGSSNLGAFYYGTLGYSDQNTLASFQSSVNAYNQIVVQNTSSGVNASADLTISNDLGTASTYYANFGINSSGYSGTGSFGLANATYIGAAGGATASDLVLGTFSSTAAGAIHFVINGGATDAANINTSGRLFVGGSTSATARLHLAAGTATASTAPLKFTSGTNLTTAEAGAVEYDGTALYMTPFGTSRGVLPAAQLQVLSATYTLTSQTAAQKLLNATTNGAVAVVPGLYEFECQFMLTGMSTTSGTFGFALAGTATYTQQWMSTASRSGTTATTITTGNTNATYQTSNTAANTAITGNSTNTTGSALIKGFIRVTVAGTVIPQVSLSQAAAAVVQTGAYFKITPLSATSTATSIGNWT